MLKQFDFEVSAPAKGEGSFTAVVRVTMTDDMNPAEVLQYLQSPQLKEDFRRGWIDVESPGYGFAVRNGPSPVFNDPEDRSSGVAAYEQEFTLTRSL